MQSRTMRYAWSPATRWTGFTVALLWVSPLSVSTGAAMAADLQSSTDSAAVEAKKNLCIALNRGGNIAELKEKFFEFYDGKIVSASRLRPEIFRIGQIGPLPTFKVVQVVGPNEMLASIDGKMFKIKGVSTADMADDQLIRLTDFFSVRTTETYNTVAGSTNTVYVLEPARGKMPEVKPSRVYPWFNKKDEVVITGEFKTINGPNAVFLVDGQESKVPLTKFTRGDRDVMRVILDRYPQEKPEDKPQDKATEKPPPQPVGID
jgi:hypothetical protein